MAFSALLSGCGLVPQAASAPPAGAAPLRTAAASAVAPGSGITSADLIVEPDDGVRAITRAIRNANSSIWLTMYILTDHTIIHDLEYAHAYGVDVRVILEPHPYGSYDNTNLSAYNNLMAADIPVRWSSSRYLLTHEKAMLIDGSAAYIMTTNFSRAAFRSNREFDVVDHSPRDVAVVRALFNADWAGRPFATSDADLPLSPVDARPLLAGLIGSARHTLDVYAEELQDAGMEEALATAARRGVRVRLILPQPSGTDHDAPGVALATAAGVVVHRLPQSYLYIHAKAIVVDGRRAFVGSENLSTASLDHNRELGVIVADPSVVDRLESTFSADWPR